MFTGIGIIASGIRPTVCGLQAYHWEVMVHLAWFSSITHLSALSFLRHYLVNRPRQLWIRGLLMAVLAGLLAGTVVLAGSFDWEDRGGLLNTNEMLSIAPWYYARCVFTKKLDTNALAFESMISDLLLIAYGYTIRLVKTWKWASRLPTRVSKILLSSQVLNRKPRDRRRTTKFYLWTCFLQPFVIALGRVLYLHLNFFTSYLAEVMSYYHQRHLSQSAY